MMKKITKSPGKTKTTITQRAAAGPDGATLASNQTGLPDALKNGIEALSGLSLDDVRVHTNSSKPAQLDALAYAQGTDIHIGPGQERHLPHEAWHVVQQAQGRVKPTMQMRDGVPINDNKGLEHEADVMGAKALQQNKDTSKQPPVTTQMFRPTIQRMTARIRRDEDRDPTEDEIEEARAIGRANSERVAGHGRAPHGRRVNAPSARREAQAQRDREEAEEQAIQLKTAQGVQQKTVGMPLNENELT